MQRRSDFLTPIGGTGRLFTAGGRSVHNRIDACRIGTRGLTIVEKDVDASQFDSLQAALNCITVGSEGCVNLTIPDGNYVETIVLQDTSNVKLTLCGVLEPQFGQGFQAGKEVVGPAAFGSGISTLTSVANVITISNSGDAPDLTLLNIVQGDTIMVQNDSGVIQRRTIDSVTADSITLTSNVTVGGTVGSGFVFLPRVHITGSVDTAGHLGKFTLKGVFVSSSDGFGVQSTSAPVCMQNSVIRTVDAEAPLGALYLSGAAVPRSDLQQSAFFGSRGLTVERIHGIEGVDLTFYVDASTQEGWAVRLDEGSVGFLENAHIAGQPTGSLVVTADASFLDIEGTEITVNLADYDGRMVRADLNSTINIHDDSVLQIVDPAADARHASAINAGYLTVCGVVDFLGNSVATQSAIEAANGAMVVADHSNIDFNLSFVAGDEYDVDTLTGIAGAMMAAMPIVGPSASNAIINNKF